MMAFNIANGVANFQTALTSRLSGLSSSVASGVLERVNTLSFWERTGSERPSSLRDLVRPRLAVHLVLNPSFGGAVCRLLSLEPRDVFRRETRPDRLLPMQDLARMTLTDHIHSVPAAKIVLLLQAHPETRLFLTRGRGPEIALRPSIISLMMMAVKAGEEVVFRAEGNGSGDVLRKLREYNGASWFASDRANARTDIRPIEGTSIPDVTRQILDAMEYFGAKEISGIYHPETRKLYVGRLMSGHREIAKSAGFDDPNCYTRINFDGKKSRLWAYFPPDVPFENAMGMFLVKRWLAELFAGVPISDDSN